MQAKRCYEASLCRPNNNKYNMNGALMTNAAIRASKTFSARDLATKRIELLYISNMTSLIVYTQLDVKLHM